MLRYLKISNLAIIDRVEVEFGEGFNVLTGETGAGKSILIGALNLLLGAKGSRDMIRTGQEDAEVEGLFEIQHESLLNVNREESSESSGELVISRKIMRSGRSRCLVNGSLVPLSRLEDLGKSLISIFGQHEHHLLLDPTEHLEILDRFGGLEDLADSVNRAFEDWKSSERALAVALRRVAELESQGKENDASIKELTSANLLPGEEENLSAERESLRGAEKVREKAFEAFHVLYSRSGSILESLSEVRKAVDYLAGANPQFSKMRDNFEEAVYRMEDVSLELRNISEKFRSDPRRLEIIEDRLSLIRRLKKKYGMDLAALKKYLVDLEKEAGDVLDASSSVKKLQVAAQQSRHTLDQMADKLSKLRGEAAKNLGVAVQKELAELSMPQAQFKAVLSDVSDRRFSPHGFETVEFHFSANPGEALRPLARIASGGELSRIMLAVKALQAHSNLSGTVIFDEVDSGIGGHTATAVGSRLLKVARSQQVLCVTHLHQIAAMADHHLSVIKMVDEGRTRIQVNQLDHDQRISELARMLGASPDSQSAVQHARGLMEAREGGRN
jgi:DNA repair protein RecN (Recombination protein N)